jgi:hypothetical protein
MYWVPTPEYKLILEKFPPICINFYFLLHGLLDVIVSDRDSCFNSNFWKHPTGLWETKLAFSTAFPPQADGQAEKGNPIIKQFLHALLTNKQTSWDTLLSVAEFVYNAYCHQSRGMSPFEADLGYITEMPLDTIASTQLWRSPRGYPDITFPIHMANILKKLKASPADA